MRIEIMNCLLSHAVFLCSAALLTFKVSINRHLFCINWNSLKSEVA